jgi:hypothetical protein
VQIGTASFGDPGLMGRLAGEMEALLDEQGIGDVNDLIGTLRMPHAPPKSAPESGSRTTRIAGSKGATAAAGCTQRAGAPEELDALISKGGAPT